MGSGFSGNAYDDFLPTKVSGIDGIDGIETDPNEIAPMALFGLAIKEQEVETLAKAYLDAKAERDALREALHEIVDVLHAVKSGPRALHEAELLALAALTSQERPK